MKEGERYLRQLAMSEIGTKGQDKLRAATAVVVGCGGLASPVLSYLSSAGLGNIVIVDADRVELTDLNRQFLYREGDIGRIKTLCAKEYIEERNSEIHVSTFSLSLNAMNAEQVLRGAGVVLDCVDNDETRILVSRACRNLGIPIVEAGICGFYGYVLPVLPGVSACIECLREAGKAQTETDIPVIGATAGVIGSLQVMEAIKALLGLKVNYGTMIQYDGLEAEFINIDVKPRANCGCRNNSCLLRDEPVSDK